MTDRTDDTRAGSVRALGERLAALADSPDDLECLEMFAQLLEVGPESTGPLLLSVLVEPRGAQVLMVGHPCPGLTLQVDDDLRLQLAQLWHGDDVDD